MKFILLGAVEEMFARCHLLSKFQQTLLCIVWWGVCREKLGEVKKCVASTVVRKVLPGKGSGGGKEEKESEEENNRKSLTSNLKGGHFDQRKQNIVKTTKHFFSKHLFIFSFY